MAEPRKGIKLRIKVGGQALQALASNAPGAAPVPSKKRKVPGFPEPDASLDALAKALRLHPPAADDPLGCFPAWDELVAEVGISASACSGGTSQHAGGGPLGMGAAPSTAPPDQPPSKRARTSPAQPGTVDSAACQEGSSGAARPAQQLQSDAPAAAGSGNDSRPMQVLAPPTASATPHAPQPLPQKQQAVAACAAALLQPHLPHLTVKVDQGCCTVKDESLLAGGVLSSSSGEATTFGLYASLSTSPPEVTAQLLPPLQPTLIAQAAAAQAAAQEPLPMQPPLPPTQAPMPAATKQPAKQQQEQLHSQPQPPASAQANLPPPVEPQRKRPFAAPSHSQPPTAAATAAAAAAAPTPPPPPPSNKRSIAVQTQEAVSLLPPRMLPALQLPVTHAAGGTVARPTPLSQLTLPPHKCYMTLPGELSDLSGSEAQIRALMERAKDKKRQADRQREAGGSQWTLQSLALYVESALLFMTAAECMLRLPGSSTDRANRASGLCVQTADFIIFTVRAIESMSASQLAKDSLRVLCEKLTAVCFMRECVLSAHKLKDYADRMDKLMADSSRSTAAAAAAAAGGGAGAGRHVEAAARGGRPPLADGTASSHDAGKGHMQHVNMPTAEFGVLQSKLVAGARQTARWAEYVRKSTCSFQTLMEREETRGSEAAMTACMHIAAMCMGGGFVDGARAIAHAYQALACVKSLQ